MPSLDHLNPLLAATSDTPRLPCLLVTIQATPENMDGISVVGHKDCGRIGKPADILGDVAVSLRRKFPGVFKIQRPIILV